MAANLVDFHCHLDLFPNFEQVVDRCERAGVFTLTVTTTPKAWLHNDRVTGGTKHVRAAVGLHPQLVGERASEIGIWEDLLPKTRYVGEVGLDAGPRYFKSLDAQKLVFERILRACAKAGGKVLTVHSVRSVKGVLDMVETLLPRQRGRVVLHWFTGSASDARRAVDLGCYFSINRQMLANEAKTTLVASLPRDRILTETDGPFTPAAGRPAEPIDVGGAVEALAEAYAMSRADVAGLVLSNLRTLLS